MTALDVLKAARKRIDKPENWLQGEFARTADGYLCESSTDPTAAKWCMLGACNASGYDATELGRQVRRLLVDVTGVLSLTVFNDSHTHAEVLAVLDKAITLAEKETV